jgi:hypothetical protein
MTVPSDPIQPGAPAPKVRPGSVTASGYALIVIGVLSLVGVVTALGSYSTFHDAFSDAYKGTPMENSSDVLSIVTVAITIATSVLFAVAGWVLGPLVLRGKQPARIISWVVCGLLFCCQGGGLVSSGFSGASFGQSNTNGVDVEELQRRLVDDLPGWVRPAELASGAVMLVLAIVVIVLLALPSSHPFFRKQAEQWAPPAYPTV